MASERKSMMPVPPRIIECKTRITMGPRRLQVAGIEERRPAVVMGLKETFVIVMTLLACTFGTVIFRTSRSENVAV